MIAGFGHGLAFRSGLAAVNAAAPADQRAAVASSFFVVAYVAISLPVIGEGVLAQVTGLRAAGLIFAAAVAAVSIAVLALLGLDRASGADRIHRPLLPARSTTKDTGTRRSRIAGRPDK